MSANKQRTQGRFWSTFKQSLTGLFAQAGYIDIVADTTTNHLFAIKSNGTQVDLEANTSTGSASVILDFDGSAGAGEVGIPVLVATLPANIIIDEVKIFQQYSSLAPAEYPRLVPNTIAASINPALELLAIPGTFDLAGPQTCVDINTNGKTIFDCASRSGNSSFVTSAGDKLQLTISGDDITAGTLVITYTYIIGSQIQSPL